jgi:F0F1-type ATP synthase membrane subunit b/b'
MIEILTIILLIFGVLQIILFFKIWGMTDDIKDIRNKYINSQQNDAKQPNDGIANSNESTNDISEYKSQTSDFNINNLK